MKPKFIVIVFTAMLLFSCSKDEDGDKSNSSEIVGTWFATELEIDNATASSDAKNARSVLNFLTARKCYVITFVFDTDLSVTAENSVNYIKAGLNSEGTGLDIPCPTDKDTDKGSYTYDGTTLTIQDSAGKTSTIKATIENNTLSVDAADLDLPSTNFKASGRLIFERQ